MGDELKRTRVVPYEFWLSGVDLWLHEMFGVHVSDLDYDFRAAYDRGAGMRSTAMRAGSQAEKRR